MDRLNDRIGCGREEAIDQMGTGDGLRLRAAVASVFGPHAGKGEERPIIVERKPNDIFFCRSADSDLARIRRNYSRGPNSGSPASTTLASEVEAVLRILVTG
jgi:hypothetical protein